MCTPMDCNYKNLKATHKHMQKANLTVGLGECTQTWTIQGIALGKINERLSTQPGFARLTAEIKILPQEETRIVNSCFHRKSLREPQNPYRGLLVKAFIYESQLVKTGGGDCFFKCKCGNMRLKETWKKSRRHDLAVPKEQKYQRNKMLFLISKAKEMEIYKLPDKEFKITALKSSEIYERI